MGGFGSGRWSGRDGATTDSSNYIDISFLKKRGFLKEGASGILNWSVNGRSVGSVVVRYHCNDLKLNYRYLGDVEEKVEQIVQIVTTPCNYGGFRFWFLCPKCSIRIRILYCAGKLFLCRHCYELPYQSQCHGRLDRVITRKHKLGERIFEQYKNGRGFGKKKGMHWKTYNRLYAEYLALEKAWFQGVRLS
jgi:hypothetical protein